MTKRIKKLFMGFLLQCMLIFGMSVTASAAVDNSFIDNNIQQLKNTIISQGSTNTYGDKFLKYIDYANNITSGVVYDRSENTLDFICSLSMGDGGYSSKMKVYIPRRPNVTYVDIELIGRYNGYEAHTTFPMSTYNRNQKYNFSIDTNVGVPNSSIQDISNASLKLSMSEWETLLLYRANMRLSSIGFTSLCEKHSYQDTVEKKATCTEEGKLKKMCSYCGTYTHTTIAKTAHTPVAVPKVEPTCTAAGKTEGSYCSVCNKVITSQNSIPAKGHSWSEWSTQTEASVLAEGMMIRTCQECGATETKTIDKLPATGKLNVRSILLKVKQTTTGVKVVDLAKEDKIHSYTSSNKKVFTVTSKGKITATGKGTAKLFVKLESGKTLSATVKVQTTTVRTTSLHSNVKTVTLKRNKAYQLKVTRTPFTSQEKITYTSSKKSVAVVTSTGKILAKGKGTSYITAKSGKKQIKIKVVVK